MHDDARWTRVQLWKPVREVFAAADALFEDADRLRAAADAEAAAIAPIPVLRGKTVAPPGAPAAYLRRRVALREAIDASLDVVLNDGLGPWQTQLCVIAIASAIDERERVLLGALAEAWRLPLLQTQLFEIDDGGDRFFVQLQEMLKRADVHEMVFEIHLLCLRAGFVGRYRDRRPELEQLIARVVERLRPGPARRAAAIVPDAPPPARRRVGFVDFPLRYYLGVAVLAVGLFVTLRIVSSREIRSSNLAEYCHDDGTSSP